MMKRSQKIIRIEQIADMEIHNLRIHRRAPAVILKVFRCGKAVRGQPLYAFLTRCRIGIHIAQRRQLTAHFSKQLLTAAQISRLLPSGRHADCMLPQRYRAASRKYAARTQARSFSRSAASDPDNDARARATAAAGRNIF